jgi:hypothetical protein
VSLIQNIINFLLGLSIPISIGLFTWAGVLYITSVQTPANLGKAKGIFKNAIQGLVIALCAYLIVETLFHAILKEDYWTSWNQIDCVGQDQRRMNTKITDIFSQAWNTFSGAAQPGGQIIYIDNRPSGAGPSSGGNNYVTVPGQVGVGQTGVPYTASPAEARRLCGASSSPYCRVGILLTYGLNANQAKAMSCIAMTENGGNAVSICNANHTSCGLFQINNGNWDLYAKGLYGCENRAMKQDGRCNMLVALRLFATEGYQPWTGICNSVNGCSPTVGYRQPWNANARSCVQTFDPGTTKQIN